MAPNVASSTLLSFGPRFRIVSRTCSSVKWRDPQSESRIVRGVALALEDVLELTCMVDDHDVRESKEMIESDYVVQRRRSVATNVPHDHSLCEQSVDDGMLGLWAIECGMWPTKCPQPKKLLWDTAWVCAGDCGGIRKE